MIVVHTLSLDLLMAKDVVEKMIEAPAVLLEETVELSKRAGKTLQNPAPLRKARDYWQMLGPGLTTGAADDDPSGIATYSQTGATYGFQLLWLSLLTFPLMAVVQEMCARIGMVTGRGLAANIRQHFPRPVIFFCTALLFFANTLNLGADLGAMAKATQLLFPNASFLVLLTAFTLVSLMLEIFTTYQKYAHYLKWLALILLSYVFSALIINLPWGEVLKATVTPQLSLDRDQIIMICAILGTTISPYLFFWQTSQEVEEAILAGKTTLASRQEVDPQAVKDMRVDVWSGMFLSNLVMFFIIVACAGVLFTQNITITTAADAAEALRPVAGDAAYVLFALGIIGTGMLAVPVLAGSTSYAMAESFGWKQGLYRRLNQAYSFYGVIIISMLFGWIINLLGIDPIKALIYSAVANGLVAPIVLAIIVLISANKKIMKEHVNSPLTTLIGILVTGLMLIAGVAAIVAMV